MIFAALFALPLAAGQISSLPPAASETPQLAQMIIRQRLIIRVPTRDMPAPPPTKWDEKKGPKCIPGRGIAGAALISPDTVDFVLPEGQRVRARLETSCPALDYYNGFYLRPDPSDGQICAKRDAIHARSGGECMIRRFRRLTPER